MAAAAAAVTVRIAGHLITKRRYNPLMAPVACDLLLTNAVVVTMDAQFTLHRNGVVAIRGDSIVGVGADAGSFQASETIDCRGGVVMPGLVNAHTHVPMTLLRGLADD